VKLAAGDFLAGAGSRLLPPSIPFRFFGAAVVFHLCAWIALVMGADAAAQFAGGLGWPLAALHFVTLGVLAMTAIGASLQLLPVATRLPVGSERWPAAIWWLYTPGVAMTALGMGVGATTVLAAGAMAVVAALVAYAALLARNLTGAKGMPVVVAHGWAALASLVVVIATALALAGAYVGTPTIDHATAVALHVVYAAYGFMGMLALGLSYIVVPMFALSAAPAERPAWASFTLAVLGLLLAGAATLDVAPGLLRTAAVAAGLAALVLHLRLMTIALKTGMRRHLGRSFALVRIAWAALVASLVLALALAPIVPFDASFDRVATLFGFALIGGWLLTFLLGILQRIVPFLASMHAGQVSTRGRGLPPTPSALTAERPLAIHFICHLAALALLAFAIATGSALAVRAAAAVGTAGALAFGVFFATVMRRMRRRKPPAGAGTMPAS
jgi:hypothetical protein